MGTPARPFRLSKNRQFFLQQNQETVFDLSDCIKQGQLHFTLDDEEYVSCLQQGQYFLKSGNRIVLSPTARLTRTGILRRGFDCQIDGKEYSLDGKLLRRGCEFFYGNARVGSIRREGLLGASYTIDLPPDIDLIATIFLFWLAVEVLVPPLLDSV